MCCNSLAVLSYKNIVLREWHNNYDYSFIKNEVIVRFNIENVYKDVSHIWKRPLVRDRKWEPDVYKRQHMER